jgi:hypothetical protein
VRQREERQSVLRVHRRSADIVGLRANGMSFRAIGRQLGISEGSVAASLRNKRLRKAPAKLLEMSRGFLLPDVNRKRTMITRLRWFRRSRFRWLPKCFIESRG